MNRRHFVSLVVVGILQIGCRSEREDPTDSRKRKGSRPRKGVDGWDDESRADLERMQGEWTVIDAELGDEKVLQMIGETVYFRGNKLIQPKRRRRPRSEIEIQLDSTHTPKHLDYPNDPDKATRFSNFRAIH